MKKKFKIMYGENYFRKELAGKPYISPKGCMIMMNGSGVLFLYDATDPYMPVMKKLSEVVYKYDVVWEEV